MTGSGSAAIGSVSTAAAGLAALTSRGGGRAGAVGLTGSAAFLAGAGPFLLLTTGVSANMCAVGSVMLRCFANRSTNWRATTSSIVLEALFTSMP